VSPFDTTHTPRMRRGSDRSPLDNISTMNMGPENTITADLPPLQGRSAANPVTPHRNVADDNDPMLGTEFRGYRVVRPLASGGMGMVYVAEYVSSLVGAADLKAAVKILKPQLACNDDLVNRFIKEARAATKIKNDGIAKIIAVDRHESGCLYILMELLEGMSLRGRLLREKRIELVKALSVIRQAALILQTAHDAGIVHRDLKPENIFLARDTTAQEGERVKLLDFGIAKLPADAQEQMDTAVGTTMGTARYMPPEQWTNAERVDHRADLYALGCILFEMLCGQSPFVSSGKHDDWQNSIMLKHILDPPPSPRAIVSEIPPAIEDIILRLLQKDPARRFESAKALVVALDAVGDSRDPRRPPMGLDSEPCGQAGTLAGTSTRTTCHWTEKDARQVLARAEREGRSIRAMARELGVSPQRLYRWRKRLRDEDMHGMAGFGEMRGRSARQIQPFAVQTRNGRSVAVWPGFDAAEFARLLAVVEEPEY
jgi:serine/threonine protein kinase